MELLGLNEGFKMLEKLTFVWCDVRVARQMIKLFLVEDCEMLEMLHFGGSVWGHIVMNQHCAPGKHPMFLILDLHDAIL